MLDDLLLAKRIKEGDIKAFESLFRHYYSLLCRYVAGITGDIATGEEIVEELFYVLWRDKEQVSIFSSVSSYLYRAARNGALLYCQHRAVMERHCESVQASETLHETTNPQKEMEYKELQNLVERTLCKLPPRRSKIFALHRDEGKKYHEIAAVLSISVKTVEVEMTKALRALRIEIEKYN